MFRKGGKGKRRGLEENSEVVVGLFGLTLGLDMNECVLELSG